MATNEFDFFGLLTRARTQIELGKRTGSHTGSSHNIYQIAEELVEALSNRSEIPLHPTEEFEVRAQELFISNGGKHSSNCRTAWDLHREFSLKE